MDATGQVLPSNHRLDDTSDHALLVHVDQRFEMHGCGERRKSREDLRARRCVKVGAEGVDANRLRGSGGVNQVGEFVVSVELRQINTY